MAAWQTLSSEEVYKTPWIRVRRDEVLNHRGKPLTYSVIELHHPVVFIIALDNKKRMLLQNMYRYTTDQIGWEIPAGHSDGQEPLRAAKRELLEETGFAGEDWTELGTFYEANGIANIPAIYFLVRNVHEAAGERDDEEEITDHRFMSIAQVESVIQKGEVKDANVLISLQLLGLHNKKGEG